MILIRKRIKKKEFYRVIRNTLHGRLLIRDSVKYAMNLQHWLINYWASHGMTFYSYDKGYLYLDKKDIYHYLKSIHYIDSYTLKLLLNI